jgi:hypothetical protein
MDIKEIIKCAVNCCTCDKSIKLRPSRIGQFKKNYCDNACRTGEKYSWIAYILANMRTMTTEQIGQHIGIPKGTLRTWAFRINQDLPAGYRIRFTKVSSKHMEPIKTGKVRKEAKRKKKVKKVKKIKKKIQKPVPKPAVKVTVIKKKPKENQATQHGPMLAGKTLINQQVNIKAKVFNPDTHERVRDLERKCWVEREKVIKKSI